MVGETVKLDDIAKMAIDEVAMELKEINDAAYNTQNVVQTTTTSINTTSASSAQKPFEINVSVNGEEIFLKNLKERVLVLFEGISARSNEDLQNRLDLTLKFLEFVLANVENRLSDLQK